MRRWAADPYGPGATEMNVLLRLVCGLVGVVLLLAAFIPGALAFHSAREWWLLRSSPYTGSQIEIEIGSRSINLTPGQRRSFSWCSVLCREGR